MPRHRNSLTGFLFSLFAVSSAYAGSPASDLFSVHNPDLIQSVRPPLNSWQTVSGDGCMPEENCSVDAVCELGCVEDGCSTDKCPGNSDCTLAGLFGINECSPWKIGGRTEVGYTNNNVPLSQASNDLLSFNDVPDTLLLNQQWLYAERVASKNGEWGLGGRVDLLY